MVLLIVHLQKLVEGCVVNNPIVLELLCVSFGFGFGSLVRYLGLLVALDVVDGGLGLNCIQ